MHDSFAVDETRTSQLVIEPGPESREVPCPDPEQIVSFVLGILEGEDVESMIDHVRCCSRCRLAVRIMNDAIETSR